MQREFASPFLPGRLSGDLNAGRVCVKVIGLCLEAAGNPLDLVAQPNQVGVLVAESEAAGVGRSRLPNRRHVPGHRPVEHVVEPVPDTVDVGPHLLAARGPLSQVTGQREQLVGHHVISKVYLVT